MRLTSFIYVNFDSIVLEFLCFITTEDCRLCGGMKPLVKSKRTIVFFSLITINSI